MDCSLTKVESEYPIKRDVIVDIGWDEDDFLVESLDGASGFASYPNRVEIEFNSSAEDWRRSLKSTTVHEYAHIWGYDQRGRESKTKWGYILEEAFTQHMARDLVPEYQSPWWTRHNEETVAKFWTQIKETELDEASEEAGPIFISSDDESYPLGLGYSLSFQIGRRLLSEYDLTQLPFLNKEAVVRAGDHLYGC